MTIFLQIIRPAGCIPYVEVKKRRQKLIFYYPIFYVCSYFFLQKYTFHRLPRVPWSGGVEVGVGGGQLHPQEDGGGGAGEDRFSGHWSCYCVCVPQDFEEAARRV